MSEHRNVWIDLENTPHVPFFLPIIRELEAKGFEVILTARDFAQTQELVEQAVLNAKVVGGEYGGSTVRKTVGILTRAIALAWYLQGKHIALAVGHGSRGLLLASKLLRIPSLTLYDYEGASVRLFNRLSTFVMTPEVIPFSKLEQLGLARSKYLTYPGLKEETYLSSFTPDNSLVDQLGLATTKVIVTIRPPSATAHYRSDESSRLFAKIMKDLSTRDNAQIVLIPRNKQERRELISEWDSAPNVIIPTHAVNGMNLLYHSDLVIGGGGTMNREAAVLGVPVISIFKGPEGAVDRWLIEQGKMIAIDNAEEIIPLLRKRDRTELQTTNVVREAIVNAILNIIA